MKHRFLSFLAVSSVLLAALSVPTTSAQTAPAGMEILCNKVSTTQLSSQCRLMVPAETIGSELDITIPKQKLSTVANLQRGANVSNTSAFFKLNLSDQGADYLLEIHFADVKAQAFSSNPYVLVTFSLTLNAVQESDFPIVINAQIKAGSRMFTPAALAQDQASFSATADTPLPIQFTLDGSDDEPGDTTTDTDINSSFTFEGNSGGGGGNGLRQAPVTYCFDDPISSMTDAEWEIICEAKRRGIVSGNPRPNGVFFFPNEAINRAEVVKIITLGVLRSLGFLSDADFEAETQHIRDLANVENFITYKDIEYEANGEPPWFAVFVNIATDQKIVHGYLEDDTYRAVNKINNAEAYRVIVEAGRVASDAIAQVLEQATTATRTQDWFMKYARTLDNYDVSYSQDYPKFTLRKDFLIIVMNLLAQVGL